MCQTVFKLRGGNDFVIDSRQTDLAKTICPTTLRLGDIKISGVKQDNVFL